MQIQPDKRWQQQFGPCWTPNGSSRNEKTCSSEAMIKYMNRYKYYCHWLPDKIITFKTISHLSVVITIRIVLILLLYHRKASASSEAGDLPQLFIDEAADPAAFMWKTVTVCNTTWQIIIYRRRNSDITFTVILRPRLPQQSFKWEIMWKHLTGYWTRFQTQRHK